MCRNQLVGAALAVVVGSLSACAPGGVQCGPGTEARDGACVSSVKDTTCGPGSTRDPVNGQCISTVTCGPGTTFDGTTGRCEADARCGFGTVLNPATGLCEPETTCGIGTNYDAAAHVCRPDVTCGTGTVFDAAAGHCKPEPVCGEGTFYDADVLLCVPEVSCGPGLSAVDGVCRSPADVAAGRADVVEPVSETNDPALGGTPAQLTLEAQGQSTVFVGVIARPVDLDNDGDIDQDRDVWQFEGQEGDLLRIRVLSNGLPQPAFILDGPRQYRRQSAVGVTLEPDRYVVLPYTGTYLLTVVPVAALASGAPPVGSPDAGYVGVIERLGWPTTMAIPPAAIPDATRVSGALFNLAGNVVMLDVAVDTPVLVQAQTQGLSTEPALLMFRPDRTFLGEIPLDDGATGYAGVGGALALEDDGIVLVMDWRTSNGLDASYSLQLSTLPLHEVGSLAANESLELERTRVLGRTGVAYAIDLPQGVVVTSSLHGLSNAVLAIHGPQGRIAQITGLSSGSLDSFFVVEAGRYVWLAITSSTSDSFLSPAFITTTPIDGGTWDGQAAAPLTVRGLDLQPRRRVPDRAWIAVRNLAPALLRFTYDSEAALQDFAVYKVGATGRFEAAKVAAEDDPAELHILRGEAATSLVLVDPGALFPPNPPVRDWSVKIESLPVPSDSETEPNDDGTQAQELTSLPTMLLGAIADNEQDWYRLELETPLTDSEALRIHVENLEQSGATALEIQSVDGTTLYEISGAFVSTWDLAPSDGTGPFRIRLEGSLPGGAAYLLDVRRIEQRWERENNDTPATAHQLGVVTNFPVERHGRTTRADADHYAFSLAQPLDARQGLRIRAENLLKAFDLELKFLDVNGMVLRETDHEDAVLFVRPAGTGPFVVLVQGESATRTELYRLDIDVLDSVEAEPNDTINQATALPAIAAGASTQVFGSDVRYGRDIYRIDLDGPLGASETVSIRWTNLLERGDIMVRILDGAGVPRLENTLYAGEVLWSGTGPLFVDVAPQGFGAVDRVEPYELTVERLSVIGEREPNDVRASAQSLGQAPVEVRGLGRVDDTDVYCVTLPRALAAGETVQATVVTPQRIVDTRLTGRSAVLSNLGTLSGLDPVLRFLPENGSAGASACVEVVVQVTDTGERAVYSASFDIVVGEPNGEQGGTPARSSSSAPSASDSSSSSSTGSSSEPASSAPASSSLGESSSAAASSSAGESSSVVESSSAAGASSGG